MKKQDWSEANLLTPAEVAAIFKVDPKTVAGWAKSGKLRAIKTLGGHRRYLESQVLEMLHEETPERGDLG
jgi:excisionase family DNA binding protein